LEIAGEIAIFARAEAHSGGSGRGVCWRHERARKPTIAEVREPLRFARRQRPFGAWGQHVVADDQRATRREQTRRSLEVALGRRRVEKRFDGKHQLCARHMGQRLRVVGMLELHAVAQAERGGARASALHLHAAHRDTDTSDGRTLRQKTQTPAEAAAHVHHVHALARVDDSALDLTQDQLIDVLKSLQLRPHRRAPHRTPNRPSARALAKARKRLGVHVIVMLDMLDLRRRARRLFQRFHSYSRQ
jgi:hypothetical protein